MLYASMFVFFSVRFAKNFCVWPAWCRDWWRHSNREQGEGRWGERNLFFGVDSSFSSFLCVFSANSVVPNILGADPGGLRRGRWQFWPAGLPDYAWMGPVLACPSLKNAGIAGSFWRAWGRGLVSDTAALGFSGWLVLLCACISFPSVGTGCARASYKCWRALVMNYFWLEVAAVTHVRKTTIPWQLLPYTHTAIKSF